MKKNKKWLVAAQNLQSIKTLLTLELSQYRKSSTVVACFPHASHVFVLARLTRESRAGEWPHVDFAL